MRSLRNLVPAYKSHPEAEVTVEELHRSGFDTDKPSIVGPDCRTYGHGERVNRRQSVGESETVKAFERRALGLPLRLLGRGPGVRCCFRLPAALPLRLWGERAGGEVAHSAIGTVKYPRLEPRDPDCAAKLKKRTLTNLYNERPAWLDLAHKKLDAAVATAYGWPPDLTDDQILERLLALNLERAAEEEKDSKAPKPKTRRPKHHDELV